MKRIERIGGIVGTIFFSWILFILMLFVVQDIIR